MQTLKKIFFIFIFWLSPLIQAEISPFFKNLNYESNTSSIENFILGRTCYSLQASSLSLNCNPAFLANETKRKVSLGLHLDNRVAQALNFRKDLQNNDPLSVANRLLENSKPLLISESSTLWWQHDWFAFSLVPARLQVASVVTNPAYPWITGHALFQREFDAQAGLFAGANPHFRVGANIRYIENHQFRDDFAMLDVLSGYRKLEIQENKFIYFEPAVSYNWDSPWSPEVSLVLTQLQVYNSDQIDQTLMKPEFGYATTPDFLGGHFRTSLHYTSRSDLQRFADRFRFGGLYEFSESLSTSMTLAGDEYGLGVMAQISALVLGAGFKSEAFYDQRQNIDRVTTGLFQISLAL